MGSRVQVLESGPDFTHIALRKPPRLARRSDTSSQHLWSGPPKYIVRPGQSSTIAPASCLALPICGAAPPRSESIAPGSFSEFSASPASSFHGMRISRPLALLVKGPPTPKLQIQGTWCSSLAGRIPGNAELHTLELRVMATSFTTPPAYPA